MLSNIMGLGIIIFAAFWVLVLRLPLITRLRMFAHPFLMDAVISVAILLLYSGTGQGLLAGSLAALFVSVSISMYRKRYGWIKGSTYHRGYVTLEKKIVDEILRKRGAAYEGRERYPRSHDRLKTGGT